MNNDPVRAASGPTLIRVTASLPLFPELPGLVRQLSVSPTLSGPR